MPISQQRLFDLFNAGERLQILFIQSCNTGLSLVNKLSSHQPITEAEPDLARQIFLGPEYLILHEAEILQAERLRYNLTWRRNRSEKLRKARQRANGTIPESQLLRTRAGRALLATGHRAAPGQTTTSTPDPEYARQYQAWLDTQHQSPAESFEEPFSTSQIAQLLDEDDAELDEALQDTENQDQN